MLKSRAVLNRLKYEGSFQQLVDKFYSDDVVVGCRNFRNILFGKKIWMSMNLPGTIKVQKRDERGRFMKGFTYVCPATPTEIVNQSIRVDYGASPAINKECASKVLADKNTPTIDEVMGPAIERLFFGVAKFKDIGIMPDGYRAVQKRDTRGRFVSGWEMEPIPGWEPPKYENERIYLLDDSFLKAGGVGGK